MHSVIELNNKAGHKDYKATKNEEQMLSLTAIKEPLCDRTYFIHNTGGQSIPIIVFFTLINTGNGLARDEDVA